MTLPSPAAALLTEIMLAIFRVNGRLLERGDQLVEPLNLSSARWQVLGAVALAGKPLSAPQIAEAMGITRQGAQKQLNKLALDGFFEQCLNPRHQRSPLYALTELGSRAFAEAMALEAAIKIVMEQNADIIFFTGDLVNNESKEVLPFIDVLKKAQAPMGVYSTLGNHDYGDYISWKSQAAKLQNLEDLKNAHAAMGWKLLMNEHVALKKGESEIALIGVENWGGNLNFTKYGDMKKAHAGTEKYPVKLLLSHDPSHWNMQVTEEFKDVDITFSGHTHGFQFGIEIPGWIKWSPSQFVYKHWGGLYSKENQHLYVNRGLGFLGYPGRVGIMPEITVMELYNA